MSKTITITMTETQKNGETVTAVVFSNPTGWLFDGVKTRQANVADVLSDPNEKYGPNGVSIPVIANFINEFGVFLSDREHVYVDDKGERFAIRYEDVLTDADWMPVDENEQKEKLKSAKRLVEMRMFVHNPTEDVKNRLAKRLMDELLMNYSEAAQA